MCCQEKQIFFSISLIFVLTLAFWAKLQTPGISFSTALRALAVAKLVKLGILAWTSFILALREALVAN